MVLESFGVCDDVVNLMFMVPANADAMNASRADKGNSLA